MALIEVRHNIEVAHRLFDLKGKCEAIHGHSMWVKLTLHGQLDRHGVLEGIEFGALKKDFRNHLDTQYDHKLLLNEDDPWTNAVFKDQKLPGLQVCPGDPTTENIAAWIANWAFEQFRLPTDVFVQETHVNAAGFSRR
jgi:6-pyruvoyltetrahydropterin/6-carboxytetrahydropterin synthase